MNPTTATGPRFRDVPLAAVGASVPSSTEHVPDTMESMTRMASAMAYQLNNLLAAVLGTAELALTEIDLQPSLRDDLNHIRDAGNRAAAMTRQLMAFSGALSVSIKRIRVNDVLRDIEPMLRRRLPTNVTLTIRLQADAVVDADAARLEEVVAGVVANAIDAMPGGGEVSITTTNVTDSIRTGLGATPEQHSMIVVSDDGTGLTGIARARLFEPFFSTKAQGERMGLSLASAYGTVRQLRGRIEIESAPGIGTQVRLTLPAVPISDHPVAGAAPTVAERHANATLLVVEDELGVRAPMCSVLRRRGYSVLEANNGEDALRVLQDHHAPVDLVITDVMMPEMRGTELIEMLHGWYPRMRVLFISGYGAGHVEASSEFANNMSFLGKPFSMDGLVERVRVLLDAD